MEVSLQKLDEWIQGVTEFKLLSKPEVEALCNKVTAFQSSDNVGQGSTRRGEQCADRPLPTHDLWRYSWAVPGSA